MSISKHFNKIAYMVTAFILIITILLMNGDALGIKAFARTMGYENRLFDNTKVHTIDIIMNDWDEFIANATSEQYYAANVIIDGETYKNVGIRGKGNTSLSTVSSLDSERYSFKIEFDQYDNSISYHGLDKLSLNNLIQDSTMMKDYLTYTMTNEFDATAPLCSFVYITVNGEDWGLYLAVEGLEDSFLERNYGSNYGELYKPDSMSFGGGRGNGKDFNMDDFMNNSDTSGDSGESDQSGAISGMPNMGNFDFSQMPGNTNGGMPNMGNFDFSQMPSDANGGMPNMGNFDFFQMPSDANGGMPNMGNFDFSQIPGMTQGDSENNNNSSSGSNSFFDGGFNFGGMGGFGMGSSDVKLQYIDDNIDSYSNIWNNAKTDITTADQKRLIESLEKLSNGEDIESVVNIEQVIRYFVVHNFVCNGDSYTGSMIHNYYLYEENGQLSMLPWDYNLAYGTFQGGNGQSTINTPIDAPVSGGLGEDRPMWNWILSNEVYTEMYHQYFAEFLETVDIVGIIDNAYALIQSYVEKDPTAFFTYEEFETGVETLRQFCTLRAESITMQLENEETTTNMNYVDASTITLSNMGSMGGMGGFGGGMPNSSRDKTQNGSDSSQIQSGDSGELPDGFNSSQMPGGFFGQLPEGFDSSQMPGGFSGQIPDGFDSSQMPGSFFGQLPEGFDSSQMPGGFSGQIPDGFDSSQMPGRFGGSFPGQSSDETDDSASEDSNTTDSSSKNTRPSRDNMQTAGGDFNFNMSDRNTSSSSGAGWIWIAVSAFVLCAGLVVAKLYKY